MSDEFASWISEWSIRLRLMPPDSHHQLGMLERNHRVRHEQLEMCPNLSGAIVDEEFKLGEASAAQDEASEFAKNIQRRADAAQALMQANVSRSVKAAMLARSRPLRRRFAQGEWAYYWRKGRSGTNLEKCYKARPREGFGARVPRRNRVRAAERRQASARIRTSAVHTRESSTEVPSRTLSASKCSPTRRSRRRHSTAF